MPAPKEILELIERYEANREAYKSGHYKEAQLRHEFLDPFFKVLGWDINNEKGYAEPYKEVIHEDTIKIGGFTKAPDYCFRIGGTRKFFVEAKRPAHDLKTDPEPAFQLRRYAWSAKLPLSILTDFEEFVVYDCRSRPTQGDKASTARIMYLTYKDFDAKWEEISSVFAHEAVLKGSFDKYVVSAKSKKGTAAVDQSFLEEIERWRELLAQNIALRNPKLTVPELNYAVQATIDRIIFLRICEDRGSEVYGRLMALLNGNGTYAKLRELFARADERYNSGLFHFHQEKDRHEAPDKLTPSLTLDDKPLKDIIKNLYYPDSPFEFSVLPADILGQVYEQFLGKVITLTEGHHAKVEDKPEVKKSGGVFYTPTYIVDYIVKTTVGKLLAGKTPKQAAKFRVLDPACGSGSFLINSYQFLLDWHLEQYIKDGPDKHKKELYKGPAGAWRLTSKERKRILLNNIFGVDIDSQAVEVTKLSLLLKVLEGENDQTIRQQLELFHERALPDLADNIKCGNSLIGPAVHMLRQPGLFAEDQRGSVNPFDWEREFAPIFAAGGFDAVIGNPPYLNIDDTWGKKDIRLAAIKEAFPLIYNDKTDILFYFLAKATALSRGVTSFIVSRAFLEAFKADKLRKYLAGTVALQEIIDFRNFYVFEAGITTCIIRFDSKSKAANFTVYRLLDDKYPSSDLSNALADPGIFEKLSARQKTLTSSPWVFVSGEKSRVNAKIDEKGTKLADILAIGQGMQTGCNEVFGERAEAEIREWRLKPGQYFRRATNSDIQKYSIEDHDSYLLYLEDVPQFSDLPSGVQSYLKSHAAALKARAAYQRGNCDWWRYTWPLHKESYNRKRILCPYLAPSNRFALDSNNSYIGLTDTTVLFDNGQPEDLRYILGLLNSRLLTYRFQSIGKLKSGGILEYFWNSVSKLPIRRIDFNKPSDRKIHDDLSGFVDHAQELQAGLKKATAPHERTKLKRELEAINGLIDGLVYELYDLSEDDIRVIEVATK